ncbi:MAG: UvrD-helicase domain-containing protein [Methanococcoides sp.]|nr:UvrD-helicase domain-containing protein [Methanococcoides sp.]
MAQEIARKIIEEPYTLSGEQYKAVTSEVDYLRILAGPGAGKTEVIVRRVLRLLLSEETQPESVEVITFTEKGAKVKGIDVNPQMLEIAQIRVSEASLTQNVELCEMGVTELGSENAESYDVVMGGLCFSELTDDELFYTLKEVKRILKIGGLLLIADEIIPKSSFKRKLNWLIRLPLVIITYLIAQTSTNAIKNLPEKVNEAGLQVESIRYNKTGNFIELVAKKPEGAMK